MIENGWIYGRFYFGLIINWDALCSRWMRSSQSASVHARKSFNNETSIYLNVIERHLWISWHIWSTILITFRLQCLSIRYVPLLRDMALFSFSTWLYLVHVRVLGQVKNVHICQIWQINLKWIFLLFEFSSELPVVTGYAGRHRKVKRKTHSMSQRSALVRPTCLSMQTFANGNAKKTWNKTTRVFSHYIFFFFILDDRNSYALRMETSVCVCVCVKMF